MEAGERNAEISVEFVEGPISLNAIASAEYQSEVGAIVTFHGVVRGTEQGRGLTALVYEAYQPMAAQQLKALAVAIAAEYKLFRLEVLHSTGRVKVGELSFRLVAAAAHRKEALDATSAFIEAMKMSVPIWKQIEYK